ncbi:hypothetical protein HKX42_08025 [Salinisphaera sp. USBA-960]|uniref:hypothetical protein n=1 Tax=Salinisphaera orenii TaxID=856731 RepID=UPI000DBE9D2C|nr:hypothetical protein [Salifodinibacter halophilus]NNC26819.1 hypothetical protein [Salifodinibacter halophilus]
MAAAIHSNAASATHAKVTKQPRHPIGKPQQLTGRIARFSVNAYSRALGKARRTRKPHSGHHAKTATTKAQRREPG